MENNELFEKLYDYKKSFEYDLICIDNDNYLDEEDRKQMALILLKKKSKRYAVLFEEMKQAYQTVIEKAFRDMAEIDKEAYKIINRASEHERVNRIVDDDDLLY